MAMESPASISTSRLMVSQAINVTLLEPSITKHESRFHQVRRKDDCRRHGAVLFGYSRRDHLQHSWTATRPSTNPISDQCWVFLVGGRSHVWQLDRLLVLYGRHHLQQHDI